MQLSAASVLGINLLSSVDQNVCKIGSFEMKNCSMYFLFYLFMHKLTKIQEKGSLQKKIENNQ